MIELFLSNTTEKNHKKAMNSLGYKGIEFPYIYKMCICS